MAKYEIVNLGEVCDVIAGQSPPSTTYNTNKEGLPFFQGKADFGQLFPKVRMWCNRPIKIAKPNDILISVRAPVGPTNLCDRESCIGRGLSAIRPKDDVNYKYVLYFLRGYEKILSGKGQGSTFSAITQQDLKNIKIPLPPLPIQKKIAEVLERADTAREKRRQANALTEQFLQFVFLEMFGNPVRNPKEWEIVALGDISTHVSSGSTPLGGESTYKQNGIKFIRSQNVQMNRLDLSNVVHISEDVHDRMRRTWVKNGDVLLNITGASIGRIAYFQGDDDSANVNQHVCIIRPDKSIVLPEYISYAISMPMYQKRIISHNLGATRQAFNFMQVRSFQIPLPPLNEQLKFSKLIEKIEAINNKQKTSQLEIEYLFTSLMQKAFKGELEFNEKELA
jgi:type I restriction enzyme, S subunit